MTDSNAEGKRMESERGASINAVERGKEKALSATQHGYDIVNNKPRFGIVEERVKAMGGNQESHGKKSEKDRAPYVNYNILNNEVVPKWRHITEAPERHKGMPDHGHTRDCNVLTHVYNTNDEVKKANEKSKILATAQAHVTDRMNPVIGQYYSMDVEDAFRVKKSTADAELRRQVLVDHTFPAKGNIDRSEGRNYDILRNEVIKPEGVKKFEAMERAPVAAKAALRQKWEWKRDVDEAMDTLTRDRSLNRFKTEPRQRSEVSHGYDIVTAELLPVDKRQVLRNPTVAQKLRITEPPAMPKSEIIFEARTRTTQEKVFQCTPSGALAKAHTFTGRQETILNNTATSTNTAFKRGAMRMDPLK
jgi:hypothetical protein